MLKRLSLVLTIIVLVTCGLSCSRSTKSSAERVLVLDNAQEPEYIDPGMGTDAYGNHIILQLFEGLLEYHPKTLEPVPGVAHRWEMSADGKTYTFYLRENAKWSDGSPVTAHDFVFSWQRVVNPKTASEYAYQFYPIKNAEAINKGKLADLNALGVKALDEHRLQVLLERPTAYFLGLTAFTTFRPVPKTIVEAHGGRWSRPEHIISNGAFMMTEWIPNKHVILKPNPHYWDRQKVQLDKVLFLPLEDRETALKMFLNREAHYIFEVPLVKVPAFQFHPEFTMNPELGTYYLFINCVNRPHLKDKRVRQALSFAIDRDQLVKVVNQGVPSKHFTPAGIGGYEPPALVRFDPVKAKELLAEAGYKDPASFPKTTIAYNTNENNRMIMEIIQSMWKQHLGIDVAIQNMEWKSLQKSWSVKDYDISRVTWVGDYIDPNTFLDLFITGGGNNYAGWSNARYDQLVAKAAATIDNRQRYAFFREAEQLLLEEAAPLPIFVWTRPVMISRAVEGIYPNLRDMHPLKEVRLKEVY